MSDVAETSLGATPAARVEFPETEPEGHLRADTLRNRKRVVAAALEAFAAEGIAVSMDSIARRAGVGVATIYRQFPTKEALFRAVVLAQLAQLLEEARQLAKSDDPGKALFSYIERVFEVAASKRDLVETLENLKQQTDIEGHWRRALGPLLERAQRCGAVRSDIKLDDVMALIGGTCSAVMHQRSDRAARARMARIVFDGLRSANNSRRARHSRPPI